MRIRSDQECDVHITVPGLEEPAVKRSFIAAVISAVIFKGSDSLSFNVLINNTRV